MAGVHRFEDLRAWQAARILSKEIFRLCRSTDLRRDYSLRDQICRAATSVMANIAEGFSRKSRPDFARFLDIARGSISEVQSLLYTTLDQEYISAPEFDRVYALTREAALLVGSLTRYLRGGNSTPPAMPRSS